MKTKKNGAHQKPAKLAFVLSLHPRNYQDKLNI